MMSTIGRPTRHPAIMPAIFEQGIKNIFIKNESTENCLASFEGMVQCSVVKIAQIATKPHQRFFIVHCLHLAV